MNRISVLIFIAITAIDLGMAIQLHGQPKTGVHSAWATLFGTTIMFTLLYFGGFFDSLFKGN